MTHPGDPSWLRPLGDTGITVSALTLGGGPLGSMPQLFGEDVPAERAIDLVVRTLGSPIRTIDTSNGYADGESERRIGEAIVRSGGLPADVVIITKVDPRDGDYSGDRVRASVAESKERLGLDRLPLVHLHDPENFPFEQMTAPGGAVEALVALREEGVVERIGLAGGPVPEMRRYLALDVFDAVLVHNRWTLVDRSAGPLLVDAAARGIPIINAAVYGSGLLTDPVRTPRYAYGPANEGVLRAARAMDEACRAHGVELATAALQFSLRDPAIATTVVGMSRPERLDATLAAAAADIPDELWEELESLVPESTWWLEG